MLDEHSPDHHFACCQPLALPAANAANKGATCSIISSLRGRLHVSEEYGKGSKACA